MKDRKLGDVTHPLPLFVTAPADHVTGKASETLTVTLSKNGGAFGAGGGTVADRGSGWYMYTPVSGDVDTLGALAVHATCSGGDPTDGLFTIVAYDPFSATNLGLSALPTASPATSGGLPTVNASNQVSGVVSLATGAITSGSFTAGAVDAAAIANNAIDLATFAADVKTGGALKANIETISTGAITSGAIASGALDSVWDAPTRTLSSAVSITGDIFGTVIDGTYTFLEVMRVIAAALAGKVSGAENRAPYFKNISDTKTVIVATTDNYGNRSAISIDAT